MSVLIKMKMPKCCDECDFVQYGIKEDWCYITEQDLPCNCPLIELPTHGDLIDRDVVVARLAEWSKRLIETYGENDEYVNCLSEVLEGLGCDDVVIPAERGEE